MITNNMVIKQMNEVAGVRGILSADIHGEVDRTDEAGEGEQELPQTHVPGGGGEAVGFTNEEAELVDDVPELVAGGDDESDDEGENDDMPTLNNPEEDDSDDKEEIIEVNVKEVEPADGRPKRSTAGKKTLSEDYVWNLMNMSVKNGLKTYGGMAEKVCEVELKQLFLDKKALLPMKWEDLNKEQRRRVIRSHMFLTEKYNDGVFEKLKGRMVADGRTQDRSIYMDYSSPTVKTSSVMTCLKLAATKGWKFIKVDVGGAFLCANIDDTEEVFLLLERDIVDLVKKWIPQFKVYVRSDGKMVVRVAKAMYGLIQSALLWYKELTGFLEEHGFSAVDADRCILHKVTADGKHVLLIVYVDDILILSEQEELCNWVKRILEDRYKKITYEDGKKINYLGMILEQVEEGFTISMKAYILDVLEEYCKDVRKCISPARGDLFESHANDKLVKDKAKFHTMVAKLLYLGKRGRPDILLPVQYLCTRVKQPIDGDMRKLERVLRYLKLTSSMKRRVGKEPFNKVEAYIDAAFGGHADGKSQSGCVVTLGGTAVIEICRKQKIVSKDSTEAELVALSNLLIEVEAVQELLDNLSNLMGEDLTKERMTVYQDNTSKISLVTKGGGKPRNKYMKVRQEMVKERVDKKDVDIIYIKTCRMLADILTKPMSGEKFYKFVRALLNHLISMTSG